MGIFIGPIIALVSFAAGIITKTPLVSLAKTVIISTVSLIVLSTLMGIIAIYVAFASFKLKLDPSNIVIPVITSIGDIAGVLVLLYIIKLVLL